jgi:DNA-binding transcriptional LysR family regulator
LHYDEEKNTEEIRPPELATSETRLPKMKATALDLDDLMLFIAVADAGGLSGAARMTGAKLPTLSRRMTELEQACGRRLFHRGPRGYALTSDGRALLAETQGLREVRARVTRWMAEERAPRVRVTAGFWTSRYLARAIRRVWSPDAQWTPEFLASNASVDIARREADIGIRNRRPEQAWLAGRRTVELHYAAYATDPNVSGYVTLPEGAATTPSDRWVRAHHADEIVTTASDARLALDLVLAGVGRMVLPCFAGDAEEALNRVTPPIDDLTHEEWLVCHHEARHDAPVRQALDAIHGLLMAPDRVRS